MGLTINSASVTAYTVIAATEDAGGGDAGGEMFFGAAHGEREMGVRMIVIVGWGKPGFCFCTYRTLNIRSYSEILTTKGTPN